MKECIKYRYNRKNLLVNDSPPRRKTFYYFPKWNAKLEVWERKARRSEWKEIVGPV